MLVDRLKLGNDNVTWSDHLKYLGIMFKSGKRLQSDLVLCVRRFYTVVNSVYCITRFASEVSQLHLIESFCLPLLTYGCEVLHLNNQQLFKLNTFWNNAFRKIFKINQWESVKQIQWFCERLDVKHIIDQRKQTIIFTSSCAHKE